MRKRVNTIVCPKCGDEIYSRCRHDLRKCSCGDVSIDGGFDYVRIGFNADFPNQKIRYVNASVEALYRDWEKGTNKYGKIH